MFSIRVNTAMMVTEAAASLPQYLLISISLPRKISQSSWIGIQAAWQEGTTAIVSLESAAASLEEETNTTERRHVTTEMCGIFHLIHLMTHLTNPIEFVTQPDDLIHCYMDYKEI